MLPKTTKIEKNLFFSDLTHSQHRTVSPVEFVISHRQNYGAKDG